MDPQWKKMDPDPGHEHFFRITDFLNRRIILEFSYFFHLFLCNNLINHSIISLYSIVQI